MSKVINTFKENGIIRTIKKIISRGLKISGLKISETYFFQMETYDIKLQNKNMQLYQIEHLNYDKITQFEKMKYFDFLDANNIIASDKSDIIIALDENRIIGYVCVHRGANHLIHNLGYWSLNYNEAWIGPTYIVKDYRKKGIHKELISKTIGYCYSNGIKKIYTAINSQNIPSIRSFSKMDFKLIGRIKIRKILYKEISFQLLDINDEDILKEKFKTLKQNRKY